MRVSLNERTWLAVLVVSAALRVLIAPFTGHPYDLYIWMKTGQSVAAGLSPYLVHPHIGYPPLWGLWCGVAYILSNLISQGNQYVYIFTIKLPILIADFVLALMLSSYSKKRLGDSQTGRILAATFLLNPYVLMVGFIWGMMDNLVGILLILSIVYLSAKPAWSGVSASLAFALKFYPLVFLPLYLVFVARTRKLRTIAEWAIAYSVTSLLSIWLPFILFRWDVNDFMGVGVAQVARELGGIAPLATLTHLNDIGITSIGTLIHQNVITPQLRLIWIPSIIICVLLILKNSTHPRLTQDMIREALLLYMTFLLTASWISEQLFEVVIILSLFIATYTSMRGLSYKSYVFGSALVLLFLAFNVPITSFVYPVYPIDRTPLAEFGKNFLPLLTLIFGCYLIIEIIMTARALKAKKAQGIK